MKVPFFRPSIAEDEIREVVETLRSGWLTTGPRTRQFEAEFATYVGAKHAIAVNSCTAALHIALEAVGVRRGDLVLVPTMTFAATAEVVRYFDATPVLVDCVPETLCLDVEAARATLDQIRRGLPTAGLRPPFGPVRAILPMHYGGQLCDMDRVWALAREHEIRVVEDAAHTLPASFRSSDAACFSFYANKCITTGEGGMAVTDSDELAERMRIMSLHGISKDAWKRFTSEGSWYYEILAPGYKYNLTDVAAAMGLAQLRRANELWRARCRIAAAYAEALSGAPGIELPGPGPSHAWHLYPIRLNLDEWRLTRAEFIEELRKRGIGTSVHWMPLHLHPYYRQTYEYGEGLFPVAEREWQRLVSIPLFPGMTTDDVMAVNAAIREICTTGLKSR